MPRLDEVRKLKKKRAEGKWMPHTKDSAILVALDADVFTKRRQSEERRLRIEGNVKPNQELPNELAEELMVRSCYGAFIKGWRGFQDEKGEEMEWTLANFRTYWKDDNDFRETITGYLSNLKAILDDDTMEEVREAFLASSAGASTTEATDA